MFFIKGKLVKTKNKFFLIFILTKKIYLFENIFQYQLTKTNWTKTEGLVLKNYILRARFNKSEKEKFHISFATKILNFFEIYQIWSQQNQ